MNARHRFASTFVVTLPLLVAAAPARAAESTSPPAGTTLAAQSGGDLFPGRGRPTLAAGTGLPFLGIVEAGIGVTNGFAIGVVGGITPSVVTAGIRPRVRLATSAHTALVLVAPMLFYPKASAPGPGNVGTSSWVLARPELFFDGEIGERWRVGGGMGVIGAASTEALGQLASGHDFRMPPYSGSTEERKGFAGGLWNTIAARASWATDPRTHLFAEGSLVMQGVALAEGIGGPPVVVTAGAEHSF
jgi:hypothetical protein